MTILGNEQGFATTKLDSLLAWARKYSLFAYPFATACCSQEYFAVASPRFDLARFGAEAARFSPRQADVLWVVGTIAQRQAPVLRRIYEQMMAPKWVIAFGTCASTGGAMSPTRATSRVSTRTFHAAGGFYDNYATLPGVDKIVPVDVYIPGCPPRPEMVLDGLMLLQDKIASCDSRPGIVKPRLDPVQQADGLVQLRRSSADPRELVQRLQAGNSKSLTFSSVPGTDAPKPLAG